MAEAAEGGAALAWRLFATLEGSSLVLATATAALLAYTARPTPVLRTPVQTVLITNTNNELGKELQSRLSCAGCVVRTTPVDVVADGTDSTAVDAIVVVGAEHTAGGLGAIADVVSNDVYSNLKCLEELSPLVRRGGYIAWACSGRADGAFSGAADALDDVIRASVTHIATTRGCVTVWVGRSECTTDAAKRMVQALLWGNGANVPRFSFRNAASKVSGYISRWLKIAT